MVPERLTISFDDLALAICNVVNPAMMDLLPSAKDALPSGDGVGTDHRTLSKLALNQSIIKQFLLTVGP